MYIYILAEAKSCINKTLEAKTEGSISGILRRQPLICNVEITNIPKYSVVEFTINSYTCISGCWCGRVRSRRRCDYISIRGFVYPLSKILSTSPLYVYSNGGDFIIKPAPTAVISFNITYRGK